MPAPNAPQAAPKRYDGNDGSTAYDEKHGGHYGMHGLEFALLAVAHPTDTHGQARAVLYDIGLHIVVEKGTKTNVARVDCCSRPSTSTRDVYRLVV